MITKLYIAEDRKWVELPVYNRVEFDERLDEQLDSGSIQTINDSESGFEDYSLYRLQKFEDGVEISNKWYFGFDTVEKRGEGYYIHTIELVEVTRIVMGIPIDGMKVTQPIEGEKKTLFEVFSELLFHKAYTHDTDTSEWENRFYEGEYPSVMKTIPSPEFHWECGTLLWECLCDIGNVINCIPRAMIFGVEPKPIYIDFVEVNEVTAEYEL